MKPNTRIFVGVIAPIDSVVETAEVVRERVLQAARFIPYSCFELYGSTQSRGPSGSQPFACML